MLKKKAAKLSKTDLIELYKQMLLIRRFEEKAGQLYGMGVIGGFCHLYIGQEAVVVGIKKALHKEDAMVTSYRDHGHIIACGTHPKYVMAELAGKETGVSHGKGGSMHLFDTKNHFYGGHGIVGAQVPIGTGVAFSLQYQQKNNLCVTFLGDGALHQGQVYESFNMAKLWNLPVLYIIENNEYAMGTSVKRSSSISELYKRGESFNIPGKQVDGMDIVAVHEAAREAAEYIRSGKGPMVLEMKTYRYRGHSMSDPATYRSKDEVNKYKETKDPIANFRKSLEKDKILSEAQFKEIDKEIKDVVAESVDFAQTSHEPALSELWTDVYR